MTTYGARKGTTNVRVGNVGPAAEMRLARLARELRLTDQILSADLDTVTLVDNGPAPAWTTLDGDEISFAVGSMPKPDSRVNVAVWLGTNAHEVGHVLFSPRRYSPLMQRVLGAEDGWMPGIARLANMVEDQRQERLLIGRFAPWRTYLTAALSHHLVVEDDGAWLLLAGRTWLPDEVRAQARARMTATLGATVTTEVTRIVGEYQQLTDPGDTESPEAFGLLEELHNLFGSNIPQLRHQCVVMTGGEPDTSQPGESAPASADEASGGDGDGGERHEGDTGDAGDDPGDDAGDVEEGKGAGKGAGPLTQAEIRKQLRSAVADKVADDDEVADDLDAVLDALDFGRAGDEVGGDDSLGRYDAVTDAARRLHHEVGDALLDLKDQAEPGWVKRTDSGRLNVRRLADPFADMDELFDRYAPGQMDASELEVVLLVDTSGSMKGSERPLAETTWAIRHAVDDIEGTITVLTYDSTHRVMARPGERPDDRMFVPSAQGGTQPAEALKEAYRAVADSQARNRLVVILTDGDWWSAAGADSLISAINEVGAVTVMALLGEAGDDGHGCQHVGRINDPTDLARLFQRVAAERIGAWR